MHPKQNTQDKTEDLQFPMLAIDYGQKRIGLAITDSKGMVASPLTKIEFTKNRGLNEITTEIAKIFTDNRCKSLLIGKPQQFAKAHKKIVDKIEEFSEILEEKLGIKAHFIDESYSTLEAQNMLLSLGQGGKRSKNKIDEMAATLFLKKFLERQNEIQR